MADKNEIMNALRELKEKRLLSSEAEALMKPYSGASFDLRLDFVSSSRSFGRQKDPSYDDGQKVLCTAEKWGVECDVLFSPEDNELVESMESGQDFQVTVKFIEYDALYQRVIFGKIGSGLELLEELNEESSLSNQISDDLTVKEMPEEAKQEELVAEVAPKEIIDDSLEVSTDEVIEKDKLAPQVIAFAPGQSNESDSEESVSSERNYAVGIDDEPSNKIAAIAALRSVREGMSLADAKALIESTPFIIKSNCTEDEANQIQAKFHRAGANVYQATNEEWDDIIANKQSPLVERSTVAENSGPTFGADSAGVSNVSYDEGEPREASPFPSSDEAHQEVNNTNCSSGCVALGFYVIGGLMILFWSGVENFITGLVFIGIGYAIQRASDTK
ncbi:MAG: ribosomal protein L7/L12 [Verrucomicrobiota bacterium]|nr:ribosomal protein L7/L12 [Verrucomicrobiota bacterium]